MRPDGGPQVTRQLAVEQDDTTDGMSFGGFEGKQAAQPVTDGDDVVAEPVQDRYHVVDVILEVHCRDVRRL